MIRRLFKRPITIVFFLSAITILMSYTISFAFVSMFAKSEISASFIGQMMSYVFPITLIIWLTVKKGKTLFLIENDFPKVSKKEKVQMICVSISLFVVVYLVKMILDLWRAQLGIIYVDQKVSFQLASFFWMVLVFALMPACIEEIFYKGIIAKTATNGIERYIIVVLFFTFSRQGVTHIILAFLFANLIYAIYIKEQNLTKVIYIHFLYNMWYIIFANYVTLPFELSVLVQNSHLIVIIPGYLYMLFGFLVLSLLIFFAALKHYIPHERHHFLGLEHKNTTHSILFISTVLLYIFHFMILNFT